jgi:hypothetical protein
MSDELPEWYLRKVAYRALQGLPIALPPDEPGNIVSIELARTQRAIALLRGNQRER